MATTGTLRHARSRHKGTSQMLITNDSKRLEYAHVHTLYAYLWANIMPQSKPHYKPHRKPQHKPQHTLCF